LKSLTGIKALPPWLCLSFGYGAEGMINGYDEPEFEPYYERYRQFYISLDADLSKINTGNKLINKFLRSLNFIKIPFPAIVFSKNGTQAKGLYF
jgi:hypothetical protein